MTGLGMCPVARHRATRASVQTRALGGSVGGSSTWRAGLNSMSRWTRMASLSALRRVARMRCMVAVDIGFLPLTEARTVGLLLAWAVRSAALRAARAECRAGRWAPG